MNKNIFQKKDFFLLFFILIIAFALRLYKINIPLADLHSWRQADTAAVARNFVNDGFDLLHPRYDDLSNVQSGIENPQGYRMVELPVYNAIFAYCYKIFPAFSLEIWGRLISIISSLIVISVIYYITFKEVNRTSAFYASLIYAVFPFFVFFSRVVLPESTALAFSFGAIFVFYNSTENKNNFLNLFLKYFSSVLFAIAILIKPTIIFYLFPIAYLFFTEYKFRSVKKVSFYFYFLIAIAPMFLWRRYIQQFPEGVPINEWLLTSVNTGIGLRSILFKPSFFRWIFFERINNLILGGFMFGLSILGLILKPKRLLLHILFFSAIVYLFVFQGGNVQHEYYQTLILPPLAIFVGIGIGYLFSQKKFFLSRIIIVPFILVVMSFSWLISYYQVKNYYNYSPELVQTAKIINSLTSKDDLIVTDRTGDTTLLYLAERRGAPAIFKDPIELGKQGYSYLITSSSEEIKILNSENVPVKFSNDKFTMFNISSK